MRLRSIKDNKKGLADKGAMWDARLLSPWNNFRLGLRRILRWHLVVRRTSLCYAIRHSSIQSI